MPANTPRGITYPLLTDPVSGLRADIQELATDLDTITQQLVTRLAAARQRPSCRISGLANQAVAINTNVTATFTAEDWDNASMANLGVNNTRIQITERGVYLVGASVAVTPQAGTWGVHAIINSSGGFIGPTTTIVSAQGSTTINTYLNPVFLHYATGAVTDDITLIVRQNGALAVNIQDRNLWVAKVSNDDGFF